MHKLMNLAGVLLVLLAFARPGAGLFRKEPAKHYLILKSLCNGTKEAWYVDPDVPRCCKCSPCGRDYDIAADCPDPNYCKTKDWFNQCVSYDDKKRFEATFNPQTTPVIDSTTVSPATTEGNQSTAFDGAAKPNHSETGIPWMWMAVVIFVAFVILVISCTYMRYLKKRTFPFHALRKKLCSNSSAASESDVKLDSSREEEEAELIHEGGTCQNNVPPPQPTSECGPPGICHDLGVNVGCMSDFSGPQSAESGQSDLSYGNHIIVPAQTNAQAQTSHSVEANIKVQNGAILNIQNFSIINQGHQIPEQNRVQHQRPPQSMDRPCPSGQSSRPCFPSPREMSASVSPPMPRQRDPVRGIMRRQSSEMSSTSAGPVENESRANQSNASWMMSSAREDQVSEWRCHQTAQSNSTTEKSFLTSDHRQSSCEERCAPRASEMPSTSVPVEHGYGYQSNNERWIGSVARVDQVSEWDRHHTSHSGPVQHSNSTTRKSFTNGHRQFSCEESYARPPQSDIEPSERL